MRTGPGAEKWVAAMLWQSEINRFKEDVNAAFRQAGKTVVDFASGLWQRELALRIAFLRHRLQKNVIANIVETDPGKTLNGFATRGR